MAEAITLRMMTVDDTDDVIRWRNSEAVSSHFIYRKPLTREDHLNWIKNGVETGKVVQFIIVETETQKSLGSVYMRDIDHTHQKAEFGIFIGEDIARGKGYGTIATSLILKYAFEELNLNKVMLRVFADNLSAIACYKKAGFVEEGCFREDVWIDGKPHDIVFMGILKSEWGKINEA